MPTDISEVSFDRALQLFPPQSRSVTAPALRSVLASLSGPPKPPKAARHIRNQRIHYLMYATNMKWTDDLLLCKDTTSQERKNFQMAMYAWHLGTGGSLLCRHITVKSIRTYLQKVAIFLRLFHKEMLDPRFQFPNDKIMAKPINSILAELQRYEKVPNKREPFTLEMLDFIKHQASLADPDSLIAALADWFEIGLFGGNRLSEWAQDNGNSDPTHPALDIFGDTRAFLLQDFRFQGLDAKGRRVMMTALEAADADIASLLKCWTKYRTQKNGDNGEEKLYVKNPNSSGYSYLAAMQRIIRRFIRLLNNGLDCNKTPLAVYKDTKTGEVKLITNVEIELCMRAIAHEVYGITDPKSLALWVAHSLRVGACQILHVLGYQAHHIQFLLRWKSTSFMEYLRSLPGLALQQNIAFDKAAAMPHLF